MCVCITVAQVCLYFRDPSLLKLITPSTLRMAKTSAGRGRKRWSGWNGDENLQPRPWLCKLLWVTHAELLSSVASKVFRAAAFAQTALGQGQDMDMLRRTMHSGKLTLRRQDRGRVVGTIAFCHMLQFRKHAFLMRVLSLSCAILSSLSFSVQL